MLYIFFSKEFYSVDTAKYSVIELIPKKQLR